MYRRPGTCAVVLSAILIVTGCEESSVELDTREDAAKLRSHADRSCRDAYREYIYPMLEAEIIC